MQTMPNPSSGVLTMLYSGVIVGQCSCDTIVSEENYVAAGQKAWINWIEPSLKCASGQTANVVSRTVDPDVRSPSRFGAGKHTITYTYGYSRRSKIVKQNCLVEINVKG